MNESYDWTMDDSLSGDDIWRRVASLPRANVATTPPTRQTANLICDHMVAAGPLVRCRCHMGCEMRPYEPTR